MSGFVRHFLFAGLVATRPLCAAGSKSKPLAYQISGSRLGAAGIWCFGALALVFTAQFAMYSGASADPPLTGAWLLASGVCYGALNVATTLLAQRVRQIKQADQWPLEAPAWGQWRVLAV